MLRSFVIYSVSTVLLKLVPVFLVPVYTSVFAPEQYGVIDMVDLVISLVAIAALLQLESSIARFYNEYKEKGELREYLSSIVSFALVSSVIFIGLLFLLSGYLSSLLFSTDEYEWIFGIAALKLPFLSLVSIYSVIVRFKKQPLRYAAFTILSLITIVSGAILFVVILEKGIVGVYIGQLVGFIPVAVYIYFMTLSSLKPLFNLSIVKESLAYSIPLVPAASGNWISGFILRYIIVAKLSLFDLGVFGLGMKVSSGILLIQKSINLTWQPYFWGNYKKITSDEKIKKYIMGGLLIITFLVIITILHSDLVIEIFANDEYMAAADVFAILAFNNCVKIYRIFFGLGPAVVKKTYMLTVVYFLSLLLSVGLAVLLVNIDGIRGISWSLVLSEIISLIILMGISRKLYTIGISNLFPLMVLLFTLFILVVSVYLEMDLQTRFIISGILFVITLFFSWKFGLLNKNLI